jgi:hypothetical protein
MKYIVNKDELNESPELFLRSAGYSYVRDKHSGQDSFVRRLTRAHYPRLHMYIKEQNERVVFSLHLDQKRPSYSGAHAHNAEYEGEVVEDEIKRLKSLVTHNV